MARADPGDADAPDREIRQVKNPDGQWTARDLRAGVTAQGETREDALRSLDDVIEAIEGDGGHEPTDEERRALGVDPETARTQNDTLSDTLQ